MRSLLIFILLFSFYACGQSPASEKTTVNIYLAHCDSVYFTEGESFNSANIRGGKQNDSVFIKQFFKHVSSENNKVLIKPFTNYCIGDGMGHVLLNWITLLKKNNVEYKVSVTDSLEDKYFDATSAIAFMFEDRGIPPPPPPPMPVMTEAEFSSQLSGKPFFQFDLKKDGKVYYSYDSADVKRNQILIKEATKEKIIQVMNDFEKQQHIKLMGGQVIVRSDASLSYAQYKKILDALTTKKLYNFKLVAITDNN